MEYVICLLLIYLIFKDDIRSGIESHRKKPEMTEQDKEKEKRKEEFEKELNSIMDYSIDTAIDSRKGR